MAQGNSFTAEKKAQKHMSKSIKKSGVLLNKQLPESLYNPAIGGVFICHYGNAEVDIKGNGPAGGWWTIEKFIMKAGAVVEFDIYNGDDLSGYSLESFISNKFLADLYTYFPAGSAKAMARLKTRPAKPCRRWGTAADLKASASQTAEQKEAANAVRWGITINDHKREVALARALLKSRLAAMARFEAAQKAV